MPWAWKADKQQRSFPTPQVGLEVMADAPRITHATCRYDDEIAAYLVDCLALFHCLREMNIGSRKGLQENFAVLDLRRMALKKFRTPVSPRAKSTKIDVVGTLPLH